MLDNILKIIKQNGKGGLLAVSIFLLAGTVSAEPQFGGVVQELIVCTCTHNEFLKVDDPHGGDNGTEGSYIINASTDKEDCEQLHQGEYILGMHTENSETCEIRVNNVCVEYDSGLVIDHYGSSPSNCDTGLEGDASGDGKTEMMTSDGRTADGGDEDDGGPSGGPSNATQSDRHLTTVDGVKADGSVTSGGETEHLETPDHQNYEGNGTTHMETSDHRNYEGNNDTVLTNSGKGSGYSQAGAGRPGDGYGSVGGSVGSGGLQSPVVLGNKDQRKETPKKTKSIEKVDIATSYNTQETTNKEILLKLLVVVGGIGGAGYFVFRSIKKVLS